MLNTMFCTLFMSPVLINTLASGSIGLDGTLMGHIHVFIKALIVLSSWVLGYFSIKHLPLTIVGPINASRPVVVLVGALVIFSEHLNFLQWCGVLLGFWSLFFISRVGAKEGVSFKQNHWLWMAIGSTMMGAVSALYDKYLMGMYEPLQVQAWYSFYQCVIMTITVLIIQHSVKSANTPKIWRWSIPLISLFLTVADIAYFYALSQPDAMIAIVSMLRRGSVIVSFLYGIIILREKHLKLKLIDLSILLVALVLLVLGSK
jgi:transporter family protein